MQAHHAGELVVIDTGGYGVRLQFTHSFCLTLAELTEEELLGYERAERELQPKEGEVDDEEDEEDLEDEGDDGEEEEEPTSEDEDFIDDGEEEEEEEEEDLEDEEDDDEETVANNEELGGEINAANEEAVANNEELGGEINAANEEAVANNVELGGETNAAMKNLMWLTSTMDQMKQNKECNNEDKNGDAGATIKVEPSLGARVRLEDPIYVVLSSDDEEEEEPEEDKGASREQLLQKLKQLRAESKKREQARAGEEPRMKVEPGAVKKEPGSTSLEVRRARRQLVNAYWASKTRDHVAVFRVNLIKVILI